MFEIVFEYHPNTTVNPLSSSVHSYLRSISTAGMARLASVLSHSISISIFTPYFMNIDGLCFYLTIYRVHIFYRWR